jgi:predicted nuclease of restriction endonuclease-like (RecB) superfamily
LPAPQSDLAHQLLKDLYIFDFLFLGQEAQEREIENALVQHITKFLLELGLDLPLSDNNIMLRSVAMISI